MTEEEAKTKWCPFSRVPIMTETDGVRIAGNRVPLRSGEEKFVKCLGSACMAWRWQEVVWIRPENNKVTGHYETVPRENLGHCGLAGRPQWVLNLS